MTDVYKRLATRLDELPNGYPSTESGVELKILRKIFTNEEAEMALKMKPIPETVESLAERLGKPFSDMQVILDNMVKKGQIGSSKILGQQMYRLVPFLVGIYELQRNRIDKELADLFEEYAPRLFSIVGNFEPAIGRVVPVSTQIKAELTVLRCEDVRRMIEDTKSINIKECICREERSLAGYPCKHQSKKYCLSISNEEGAFDKYPLGKNISKEEALRVIADAEKEGLVHTTYNTEDEPIFICNCCSCCCALLRGLKEFNLPYMLAKSNFVASIDQQSCVACGVCANERCPMGAIIEDETGFRVLAERCIGCGVCTLPCPTDSIMLVRKPELELDKPPANMTEWYSRRAVSRGMEIKKT